MNIPRTFYDRVESFFPYPIASALRAIRETPAALDRFNKFIPFITLIIKYCIFIILSYYRSDKNNGSEIDIETEQVFSEKSNFPALVDYLQKLLKFYSQRKDAFIIPELYSFIFDSNGKHTDNLDRLKHIISIYNKFKGKKCKDKKEASLYFEKLEVLIIELLEELFFLTQYPLINPVMVKSQDNKYLVNAHRCMGFDSLFKYDRLKAAEPFTEDRLQILNPEKNTLLELYPFLISHKCMKCQKTHIFSFDIMEKGDLKYLFYPENHELCLSVNYLFPEKKEDKKILLATKSKKEIFKNINYENVWKDINFDINRQPQNFSEKYNLLELVGTGGMGDVYKCLQTNLASIRAIKILPTNLSSNTKCIKRFEQEAKLAARLEHANIVRVIDVGNYDLERYIVMEYIEGETLRDRLNDNIQLPQEEVIDITIEIAKGLKWIHNNDIIHRDIKPENIMIDIGEKVKITDFGISKSTISAGLTAIGMPIGTAQYFSPEQAGAGEVSFYSDIYSLGVVIYEMLTGTFPHEFKDANPIAIAYTIVNAKPVPVSDIIPSINPGLEKILMKCLEKSPEKRFSDAGELLDALLELKNKNLLKEKEASLFSTRKVGGELGFKLFLEGLLWSGQDLNGLKDLIEERSLALNIPPDVAMVLLKEVNETFKTRRDSQEIKEESKSLEDNLYEYRDILDRYFAKGYIIDEEEQNIKSLQKKLNLTEEQTGEICIEIKNKYRERIETVNKALMEYRDTIELFYAKGYITDEEKEDLLSLKQDLNLSEEQTDRIFTEIEAKYKKELEKAKDLEEIALRKKEIIKNKENEALRYLDMGDEYYTLKDYESSIVEYNKALEIAPHMPAVHNSLGNAYYHLGLYKEAIQSYETTLNLNPDNDVAKNNLSLLYETLKKGSPAVDKKIDRDTEEALKKYSELYEMHLKKGYLTAEEKRRFDKFKVQHKLPDDLTSDIEKNLRNKILGPQKSEKDASDDGQKQKETAQASKSPASVIPFYRTIKKPASDLIDNLREEKYSPEDLSIYKNTMENFWSKGYLTDGEVNELENLKIKLNLPDNLIRTIQKEVEENIKARERDKLDIIDMAVTNYKTLLENIWSKGYLTEKDKETIAIQRKDFEFPENIILQIEKEVESKAKHTEEEKTKTAVNSYGNLLEKLWHKGFLSDKDTKTIEDFKSTIKIPTEKFKEIDTRFEQKYKTVPAIDTQLIKTISEGEKTKVSKKPEAVNAKKRKAPTASLSKKDAKKEPQSYTTFVSRERELDELLKYYMSSDKSEQDMVEWALLNTFGSLKQKLKEGDREWVTPSFLKSLKRARTLMPEDKRKMIKLLDGIIIDLSDLI